MEITPFDREQRRARAAEAISKAIFSSANVSLLIATLSHTPAESAEDRLDDLCNVHVRGPLSDADVWAIEGRPPEYEIAFRSVYGASLDDRRTWLHSWTRRRVTRGGINFVLSREDWLRENAQCIIRAGGLEVRPYGRDWIRIADEADYRSIALRAAESR